MFIVINKVTNNSYIFKYMVDVAATLGCSRRTVLRKKELDNWVFKDWIIYRPIKVVLKSKNKGGNL